MGCCVSAENMKAEDVAAMTIQKADDEQNNIPRQTQMETISAAKTELSDVNKSDRDLAENVDTLQPNEEIEDESKAEEQEDVVRQETMTQLIFSQPILQQTENSNVREEINPTTPDSEDTRPEVVIDCISPNAEFENNNRLQIQITTPVDNDNIIQDYSPVSLNSDAEESELEQQMKQELEETEEKFERDKKRHSLASLYVRYFFPLFFHF